MCCEPSFEHCCNQNHFIDVNILWNVDITFTNVAYIGRQESGSFLLGIRLIARSGRRTRNVRMADRLMFSACTQYSTALNTDTPTHVTAFRERLLERSSEDGKWESNRTHNYFRLWQAEPQAYEVRTQRCDWPNQTEQNPNIWWWVPFPSLTDFHNQFSNEITAMKSSMCSR